MHLDQLEERIAGTDTETVLLSAAARLGRTSVGVERSRSRTAGRWLTAPVRRRLYEQARVGSWTGPDELGAAGVEVVDCVQPGCGPAGAQRVAARACQMVTRAITATLTSIKRTRGRAR